MNLKQKANYFFAYKGNDVVLMWKKKSKPTKLSPINLQIIFRSIEKDKFTSLTRQLFFVEKGKK